MVACNLAPTLLAGYHPLLHAAALCCVCLCRSAGRKQLLLVSRLNSSAAVVVGQLQAASPYLAGPDDDCFVSATRCKALSIEGIRDSIHRVLQHT